MCGLSKLLDIEDSERGVCKGLTEYGLSVLAECGVKLLLSAVGINEGELDAHLLHRYGEEIVGAAVDGCGRDNVVTAVGDIEYRVEGCSLT